MGMDKFRKFFILFFKAAISECGPDDFSSSKIVNTSDKRVVDTVRTYQNGVDGAKRCSTTFYH